MNPGQVHSTQDIESKFRSTQNLKFYLSILAYKLHKLDLLQILDRKETSLSKTPLETFRMFYPHFGPIEILSRAMEKVNMAATLERFCYLFCILCSVEISC